MKKAKKQDEGKGEDDEEGDSIESEDCCNGKDKQKTELQLNTDMCLQSYRV